MADNLRVIREVAALEGAKSVELVRSSMTKEQDYDNLRQEIKFGIAFQACTINSASRGKALMKWWPETET